MSKNEKKIQKYHFIWVCYNCENECEVKCKLEPNLMRALFCPFMDNPDFEPKWSYEERILQP